MTQATGGFSRPTIPAPFDHDRYVPLLLTRQGERLALREVSPTVRSAITPLFVVHPVPTDPVTGQPKLTVEAHLDKLARQLSNDWGLAPAFVDLRWVDTSSPMSDGTHALARFMQRCREAGLRLAPAISTHHAPGYRASAVAAADAVDTTLCLRLSPEEWHDIGTPVGDGRVLGLLAETGRSAGDVHVILDFEDQITTTTSLALAAIRPVLRALPHANEWASVTVAGTGMPAGTAQVGRDRSAELPRLEWRLWQRLDEPGYRRPSFGDYGVQHPDPMSDFNPLYMDSSAQLRYTIAEDWFIARGQGVKRSGNEQIRGLAQQVVDHAEFSGPSFSWGDQWLHDCASAAGGPGAQSVWRKVTTNHHLTFVAHQLASHLWP